MSEAAVSLAFHEGDDQAKGWEKPGLDGFTMDHGPCLNWDFIMKNMVKISLEYTKIYPKYTKIGISFQHIPKLECHH